MKLHIKNFRSIKQLDLELAPITVLYGRQRHGQIQRTVRAFDFEEHRH